MPKIKQLETCKHPNSRKTKVLIKQVKRQTQKEKRKLASNIKQNLIGEKLQWVQQNLGTFENGCSATEMEQLILKYLGRFDEELEQIKLKHSVGQRKNRQHACREDVIKMTINREREEFKTCGIEMPDLFNPVQLNLLKNWNGELRFMPNFKLKRFSLQHLKKIKLNEQIKCDKDKIHSEIENIADSVSQSNEGAEHTKPEPEYMDINT